MTTDYRVPCPTCGVEPGAQCRTTTGTDRSTDTHIARIRAAYPPPRPRRSCPNGHADTALGWCPVCGAATE